MNPTSQAAVEAFLYHEAQLLDSGRLEDWLDLFAADSLYWIPARADAPDPSCHVSIVYDDKQQLSARIARLQSGKEYAQDPPSTTYGQVSNVVTCPTDSGGVEASAVVVVHEKRPHVAMQIVALRVRWRLTIDHGEIRISEKRLILLDPDRYWENLTFLL